VRVQLKIDKTAQPYPNIPNRITYFGLRCGGFLYKSTQSRRRQIPRTAKAGQFCPGFRKGRTVKLTPSQLPNKTSGSFAQRLLSGDAAGRA
jgi:hypothetical protein